MFDGIVLKPGVVLLERHYDQVDQETLWLHLHDGDWLVIWSTWAGNRGYRMPTSEFLRVIEEYDQESRFSLVHYIEGTPAAEESYRLTREHYAKFESDQI